MMLLLVIMIMIKIMNYSSSVPVDMTSVYEFHMWLLSLLTDICGKLMGLADNDYDNGHADENGDFDHGQWSCHDKFQPPIAMWPLLCQLFV